MASTKVTDKKRSSSLFSCFKGSKVWDSGDAERIVSQHRSCRKGSWFLRLKFDSKEQEKTKKKNNKKKNPDSKSSPEKFHKDKPSTTTKASTKTHKEGAAPPTVLITRALAEAQPPFTTAAQQSKLSAVRSCSPQPLRRIAEEYCAVLPALVAALVSTMLFGRACAIVCVCVWFYLLPWLRPDVAAPHAGAKKGGKEVFHMGLEEKKKRVLHFRRLAGEEKHAIRVL